MAHHIRRIALAAALLPLGRALPGEDCNRNGAEDTLDLAAGSSGDCNQNGVPDECDVTPASFGLTRAAHSELRSPSGIAAADLHGDGTVDIAIALRPSREVVVLSNEGQGSFPDARYAPLAEEPVALAAADLDGDGDTDIVTAGAVGITVIGGRRGRQRAGRPRGCGGVLRFLFLGGTAPAFPGEACGLDPTPDDLACDAHAPCA